jgi:signal transduction histidine kinase/ActR/RegA family two-component response regulator
MVRHASIFNGSVAMKRSGLRQIGLLPALLFAAVPLAFLIGVALFQLTRAVPEARHARAETAASFSTLRAASAVDEALQDAETGQRGYLLTGRESYLEPYIKGKARLPGLMADLQRTIPDSAEQQSRILTLQADVTTKINELDATIAAYKTSGIDSAIAIVNTDVGRNSMDTIRSDLAGIVDVETGRLTARSELADSAERQVTTTFVIGSVISGLALVVGAVLLAFAYGRAAISEQTLQATLESVREGVAAFDGLGRLRAWNRSFAKLLDLRPGALKRGAELWIDRDASPAATEIVARIRDLDDVATRTGRPALISHQCAHGPTLELFHNQVEDGHVTTVLDVSEQRQAEQALRQAQKLESLGQMTGGVAHDFNNLLTVIIGSLGFLRRSIVGDAKASERIDMLEIAAERGARLTKQLLAFARRQPLQPDVVNLGQIMQELLPLIRRAVGEDVAVENVVAGGLWNTTIDVAQFQSAVLNLAINSLHAMQSGGKLTIEVVNTALDDVYAARHAEVEPGQYVLFAVTDTGTGMDAATLARAMDPFFTTKPGGDGTGLGLPQVYGLVKQSGGHMKIYSEVGEGTTVKLYLPRSLEQVAPVAASHPTKLAVTGSETILLVDDDEIVRTTVAAMLEDLGYAVLAASSGTGALELLEQDTQVDLLFTDVVMPGMGGRPLAERAVKLRPSLRVLFTSGYTENAIVHNGRLDPGVELLSKPYDRERLAAKLRRVLDGREAGATGARGSQNAAPQNPTG